MPERPPQAEDPASVLYYYLQREFAGGDLLRQRLAEDGIQKGAIREIHDISILLENEASPHFPRISQDWAKRLTALGVPVGLRTHDGLHNYRAYLINVVYNLPESKASP